MVTIRKQWQAAYDNATFYKSNRNTVEFWSRNIAPFVEPDSIVKQLIQFLDNNDCVASDDTVIDIGCGSGKYSIPLALKFKCVTAMDYSMDALMMCKEQAKLYGCNNMEYEHADFFDFLPSKKYDISIACLNPATYNPDSFDKIIGMTNKLLIYFSTDKPICEEMCEPIYCGCQLVDYPLKYLEEMGYNPVKIKSEMELNTENGGKLILHFAYIICRIK